MINSQEIYSKLEMGIKDIDADRENLIEAIITRLKESAENENISQEERDTIKEQYIALKDFRGTISSQDLTNYHNYIKDKIEEEKQNANKREQFAGSYSTLMQENR